MSDVSTIIAAVEWIVVGALAYRGLRRWNKRFETLYDELKQEMNVAQEGAEHDGD